MNATDGTALEHAEKAAEAIRALNHATQAENEAAEWELPSDAYAVVGQLVALAQRLPQAIEQAHDLIRESERAGRLRHEDGPEHLAGALHRLAGMTEWALTNADLLHTSLSDVHAALSPLGAHVGGEDE